MSMSEKWDSTDKDQIKRFIEKIYMGALISDRTKSIREKDFVLSLVDQKIKKLQPYLDLNKINFRKINDLQSLFAHYNSLN